MSTIEVFTLFVSNTAAKIYSSALELAASVGLPVTSWRAGDPTKTSFNFLADALAAREDVLSEFIKAGFRSTAEGDWFTLMARDMYGVTRGEATFAEPTATVHNGGGGFYPRVAGDLTFKASSTGKTYHTTDAGSGVLSAGATVTYALIADEAGSDSSAAANDVDTLVTQLLGVTVVSSTAATAIDAQPDPSLDEQCAATLGALSPNGPGDAYEFVVRNPDLTGNTEITRAKTVADDDTGRVIVYVAGTSGPVSGAAITAAQAAVERWATPNCVRPTVTNASAVTVALTSEITGVDIPSDFEASIAAAFGVYCSSIEIGGLVATSAIVALHHTAVPQITSVTQPLTAPAANVVLAAGEVALPGVVGVTEV